MEPQNTNEDLGNLSYKTMPKGKSLSEIKFDLQKPAAPVPPSMPAPTPVPLQRPVSNLGSLPGANDLHAQVNMPTSPLMPSSVKPVSTLEGFDLPHHDEPMVHSGSGSGGMYLKYGLVSLGILVVLGAGYYAYTFFSKPKVDETPVVPVTHQPKTSQIPEEWMQKYFSSATCADQPTCGDEADPDHDGLSNYQEYQSLTDPNNADSDKDNVADGDEVNIFGYSPQNADSSGKPEYPDDIEAKTKWNVKTQHPFTDEELTLIATNIAQFGLHSPTIETLGQQLVDFYTNFGSTAATPASSTTTNTSTNTSTSTDALDRDTQRSDTIKQIGLALLDYKKANLKFPNVTKWDDMIAAIKPLIQTKAINTSDPKNVAPYLYTYTAVSAGADFKIGYFSETQNQAITFNAKDITAVATKVQADQRDTKRKADLEQISTALELYSSGHATSPSSPDVFPAQATWKTDLSPQYIATIPVDPSTNKDYLYTVTPSKDSYAIQAVLENPPTGKKGYVCDPNACTYY